MTRRVSLAAHRLPLAPDATRAERLQRSREMLFHALSQETAVAVVGSGCSIPLGYPSWQQFAGELIDLTLATASPDIDQRERLLGFKGRLDSLDSEQLMYAIGLCKRLLGGDSPGDNSYRSYLASRFCPRIPTPEAEPNPHRALLQLPIHRFVTTNYDCEIERALEAVRSVDCSEPHRSFTQRKDNCDQLALFALARVSHARNMVFHCHGRYDDPASIVATELDYQRWYLAEEGEPASPFLQTFDLLFTSNPILFVGFGLGDEDLLRPLRRIAAVNPERKPYRPVFALLPEPSEEEDWSRHDQLFERYGLQIIPFTAPTTSDSAERGRALCDALTRLEQERLEWRDGWFEKPLLRSVNVHARPPEPYRHYCVDPREHETLGHQRVAEQLDRLKQEALAGARVIGLVGPGGTGKSWHAMRLLEDMQRESPAFRGFFFWSSYYADDLVTGVDRLLGYIDPLGNRPAARSLSLRERLAADRYLVVLDGFERLLRPTEHPEEGKGSDAITRKLLALFAEGTSQSTLVLTSRLWPRELDPTLPGIRRVALDRMRTDDVSGDEPFSWLDRSQVSALCSFLGGHAYALFLAGRFLRQSRRAQAKERFTKLHRTLSLAHPDHRLASMIELAVETADRETQAVARPLLKRLAFFMSPVGEDTVELCFSLACEEKKTRGVASAEVVGSLLASGLLFRVSPGPRESELPAFTAHPTVRSYLFEPAHEVERDVLPNFTLAGFTSSRAAVHPGSADTAKPIRELFDRLHDQALAQLQQGRREVALQLCRSLFGMTRSRMETNTAPQWTTYDEYILFGLRVADLAKKLSPALWSFREPHELAEIEDPNAPLYADELAFVYNDIGLTLCAEGYMQDTLDVWEQGYEINRILEGTAEVPLFTLQSQLHLGHTFLELGKLPIADQYLAQAERTNHTVNDPDYAGRILGYQALIRHYQAHLDEADSMYAEALRMLKKAGGNPRAQSFFLSHRAKAAMALHRFEKAEEFVRSSHAIAAGGRADDLVAYARTARGRLHREQSHFVNANQEYHAALSEARRLGIRRLEAEILTGLSRLALDLGDNALARRRAMAALGICNEIGLGLRQTQCLLVLGMALVRAGDPRLGAAYLQLGKKLGDEQGYRLRIREAEYELNQLGKELAGP